MLVVGLTGSIGMGKSTIAQRFRERGIAVFDADAEVRRLYEGEAVPLIEAAFPGTTVEGRVDRERLARVALVDPAGLARLESIVHPLVQGAERKFLQAEAERGAAMAVLEIPLLFETGGDRRVDVTVVVSAPEEEQRRRVLARPGITPEKLASMLARQMPDAEKRRRADFVVDTGQPLAASYAQVDSIIDALRGRKGQAYERFWKE
jgi:dephospho-CoA kinase